MLCKLRNGRPLWMTHILRFWSIQVDFKMDGQKGWKWTLLKVNGCLASGNNLNRSVSSSLIVHFVASTSTLDPKFQFCSMKSYKNAILWPKPRNSWYFDLIFYVKSISVVCWISPGQSWTWTWLGTGGLGPRCGFCTSRLDLSPDENI